MPLTVSPFISLPTATTLPYTYKPLPSTLPPSSTADSSGVEREKYVVSGSNAASPEDIIKSCQALQDHIRKTQEDAEKAIRDWEQSLKEQDLAEKRRVAPGWLDRSEKILEPERRASVGPSAAIQDQGRPASIMDSKIDDKQTQPALQDSQNSAGDELDRAFGGLSVLKK